jgi:hypothetical protein
MVLLLLFFSYKIIFILLDYLNSFNLIGKYKIFSVRPAYLHSGGDNRLKNNNRIILSKNNLKFNDLKYKNKFIFFSSYSLKCINFFFNKA